MLRFKPLTTFEVIDPRGRTNRYVAGHTYKVHNEWLADRVNEWREQGRVELVGQEPNPQAAADAAMAGLAKVKE